MLANTAILVPTKTPVHVGMRSPELLPMRRQRSTSRQTFVPLEPTIDISFLARVPHGARFTVAEPRYRQPFKGKVNF